MEEQEQDMEGGEVSAHEFDGQSHLSVAARVCVCVCVNVHCPPLGPSGFITKKKKE